MTASSDKRRTTNDVHFRDRLTLPLLVLLTLIAGALRFVALDRPSVWGDEAATYGRVAGTYQDLLDQLATSSFPPLHYELEWWIGQGLPYWGHVEAKPITVNGVASTQRAFTPSETRRLVPGGIPLTPFALRFIPALAGTLFVPAVFFLARQLFGRRVSLTAAFLACFSAYALVYSRDAKMYMHFWLAVTLHVACALWWLRTRRVVPWLAWLLAGLAMVGLHGSGFFVLGLDALFVLTAPRPHYRKIVTLGGYAAWPLVVGPAYAFERLRRRRGWREWVRWERVWAWPRLAARRFAWPPVVGLVVGAAVMVATALGPLGYYQSFSQKIQAAAATEGAEINVDELGIGWVGRYNAGRQLPDYLLYTASAYLTGWEWPQKVPERQVDIQARVRPRTLLVLQAATVLLLCLLAVGVVPWRAAFARARARLDRITQEGRVFAPFRTRRVLWLAVWLTAVPWVTYTQSTDRPATVFDGVARLSLVKPPDVRWPRARVILDDAAATQPADSIAAAVNRRWTLARRSVTETVALWLPAWQVYAAAFTRANLRAVPLVALAVVAVALLALTAVGWRALGRGAAELVAVTLCLGLLGTTVAALPRWIDSDVWMPRYLGTIFPAVLVFVAVLVDRQPRWLRGATLGLFVVVNLGQFSARVWGHSEPPTGLMAADVVASQPASVVPSQPPVVAFRAYVDFGRYTMGEPGGGTLFTSAGRYYLRVLSGVPGDVRGVRTEGRGPYENVLNTWRFATPAAVASDLRNSPQVERFVVWTALDADAIDQSDPLADRLAGRYRRVREEIWPVRDHWRWVDRWQVRRRTYVKLSEPTTKPWK